MAKEKYTKVCAKCSKSFTASRETAVYCSRACRASGRYPDIMTRLFAGIEKREDTGCWEWQNSLDDWGYGIIRYNGAMRKVHRVSWELHNGPIPSGLLVCHHCDNTVCANPSHLFLGTNKDNRDDMVKKGRQRVLYGADNPSFKVTDAVVAEILAECSTGKSKIQIAHDFGLAKSTVYNLYNFGTTGYKGKEKSNA